MEDRNIPGRAGGVRMAVGVGGMGVAVLVGVEVGGCGVKVAVGNVVSVAFGATAPQPDIINVLIKTINSTHMVLFIINSFSNVIILIDFGS
jgi:hypothetical protein